MATPGGTAGAPQPVVTRSGARRAKVQTRAMATAAKPSSSVVTAKKKAQQKKKYCVETQLKDHYHIAMECKERVRGETGLVTDSVMLEHRCLWDEHYPERPERLSCVLERCRELGLTDRCRRVDAPLASRDLVMSVHTRAVHDLLERSAGLGVTQLEEVSSRFDAVFLHPSTQQAALRAAGGAVTLAEMVARGDLANGMALLRPPGHHAMQDEPCGYCFYNNAALAARHALTELGLRRVLLVDWDVHHGQGSQQEFYSDPRVLYFSVHRYEHGAFWPGLRQADWSYTGEGGGAGYNFNVPLNTTGATDADYVAIWHQLLLPVALEFSPELIVVSAGYDAALGCPEGEMEVSSACFSWLTWQLSSVCPRVCVLLEGGYWLPSLAEGAALTLRSLLGDPPPPLASIGAPTPLVRESIINCMYAHRPYWKCLQHLPLYRTAAAAAAAAAAADTDTELERHEVRDLWRGDETRPDRFETRNCYPVQDAETRRKLQERFDAIKLDTDLSLAPHAVCYVFDPVTLLHKNLTEPGHVESPERAAAVHDRHRDFGLLDRVLHLDPRSASDRELLAAHTPAHLARLSSLSGMSVRQLQDERLSFDSVYFHQQSDNSARAAAGGVLRAVETVVGGVARGGVCVVRPPGHHAGAASPAGFCLVNNAALGALHAVRQLGLQRVLLLDWDVHHGNGSQQILYDTPEVLYISIHRHDNGKFFPYSEEGGHDRVGAGAGRGYNVNVPWNQRGAGDPEYLAAFTRLVMPVAAEYCPQLVLVSAGFDACVLDPLGGCRVTPECYGRLAGMLRGLAGGRVVLVLEGGYNPASTALSMTLCTKALLGDPLPPADPQRPPQLAALQDLAAALRTQRDFWRCLAFDVALPETEPPAPPPSRGLDVTSAPPVATVVWDLLNFSEANPDSPMSIANVMSRLNIDDGPAEQGAVGGGGRTLVDYLAENMSALVNEEMFAVVPLSRCPHLSELGAPPDEDALRPDTPCAQCGDVTETWVCLRCGTAGCARGRAGHAQAHWRSTGHALLLSLADLSVWCSACDAYVDNARLYPARNRAHTLKFGEEMPWCYPDRTLQLH